MAKLPWPDPVVQHPGFDHPEVPLDFIDLDLDQDVIWVIAGCEARALSIAYFIEFGSTHIKWVTESGATVLVWDRSGR